MHTKFADFRRTIIGRLFLAIAAFTVLLTFFAASSSAQPPVQGENKAADTGADGLPTTSGGDESVADDAKANFWQIVLDSGPVGLVILLLSIGAAALVVEHVIHIRARVLMPPGLSEKVRETLKTGHVTQAIQECQAEPSLLSYIIQSGLAEIDGKWTSIEKAMEDATAEQSARLYRKVEYLSVIGNLAPMLGLLGTVIGMVMAFRDVSTAQGAPQAKELAQGIYLALVTTVEGLIVAIPALAAFAYFRNRVDQLVAETAQQALHVFTPFKRSRTASERSR